MEKRKKNTHSGQILRGDTGTGTEQSGTGTISVLFFCFDQRSYFGHNFLIYYPIWVIQVAG